MVFQPEPVVTGDAVALDVSIAQLPVRAADALIDIVVMGVYTGLAGRLVGWLNNARQQTILNRAISAMFAVAAVVLSLVRRGAPA